MAPRRVMAACETIATEVHPNIVQKSTNDSVQQSVNVIGGLRLVMCTVVFVMWVL